MRMNTSISPIYTPTKKTVKATLNKSGLYPSTIATFNWINVDFPYLHTHNHWEIIVILKGTLKHTINGMQENISKGYACLIRPTDTHRLDRLHNETDVEIITFAFSESAADTLFNLYQKQFNALPEREPCNFFLDSTFLDSLRSQALTAQSTHKEIFEQISLLISHQLLLQLFLQTATQNQAYPNWLNEFLQFLHNPECFRKSAKELAERSPYSYPHLSRIFKQYLGKTLNEHLTELKMLYAKRLLSSTSKSILDISLDLGYDSVSSFNHNFKAATDFTPLQYRKKHT